MRQNLSGNGVIEAAKEKGKFAFGEVVDQNKLAPNTVLSSIVLDTEKAFEFVIKMVQNSSLNGQLYKPGLEMTKGEQGEGIVYLAPFHGLARKVPPDVEAKLAQLTQDVMSKKMRDRKDMRLLPKLQKKQMENCFLKIYSFSLKNGGRKIIQSIKCAHPGLLFFVPENQ